MEEKTQENNFLQPKFAVMDFEWLYSHDALGSMYEMSMVTYTGSNRNLTVKPHRCFLKRNDYKKKRQLFCIDEQKHQKIENSVLNYKTAFNEMSQFVANTDIKAIYVYGNSDIDLITTYLSRKEMLPRLDLVFKNNTGGKVQIIDVQNKMFIKNFSLSVVNMYNLLYDTTAEHQFSSLDDSDRLKDVVDYVLAHDFDKKSFIQHLNQKLIPKVPFEQLPLDMDLLRVLYRSYNQQQHN